MSEPVKVILQRKVTMSPEMAVQFADMDTSDQRTVLALMEAIRLNPLIGVPLTQENCWHPEVEIRGGVCALCGTFVARA